MNTPVDLDPYQFAAKLAVLYQNDVDLGVRVAGLEKLRFRYNVPVIILLAVIAITLVYIAYVLTRITHGYPG